MRSGQAVCGVVPSRLDEGPSDERSQRVSVLLSTRWLWLGHVVGACRGSERRDHCGGRVVDVDERDVVLRIADDREPSISRRIDKSLRVGAIGGHEERESKNHTYPTSGSDAGCRGLSGRRRLVAREVDARA